MVDETMNVIRFRPEHAEPYSEAAMQAAIRNLGDPAWKGILEYARDNPKSTAGRFIGALGPVGDLNKLVVNWRHRNEPDRHKGVRAWKAVDDVVSGKVHIDKFVRDKFYDRMISAIHRAIDGQPVAAGFRYPATAEEKARLRTFAKDAKAERFAHLTLERETARRKNQARAEKKRLSQEAAARALEEAWLAHENAAAARLLEIGTLKGVKRFRAVLSSMRATDPASRLVAARVAPEDVEAAKAWNEVYLQQQAVRKVERSKRKDDEALIVARTIEMPKFRHLEVSRTKTNFRAVFQVPDKITLKSEIRRSNLIYTARSRLAKHRLDFVKTPERIETTCTLTSYEKFFEIIAVLDQELEECANSRLTPLEVEQTMGITSRERLKWTKDGRLPTDGTGSFRKNGITITFSLHPYSGIVAIKPETVERWRQDDINATKAARSNGAKKAVKTKARNDAGRKSVRDEIDRMAREASLHVLSPIAVPLVKLAFLSSICSRWAKDRRDKGDLKGEAEFYELKDCGLRIIHRQPWTAVRYVPAGRPRYEMNLCKRHGSDFREDRRSYQVSFPEWITDNINFVRKCPTCTYHEDHDYYALYELRMVIGKAEFCWHVPYSSGSEWLPDRNEIEKTPARSDDDGIVLFGRPVNSEEMILWKPQKLREEMETLFRLFDQAAAPNRSGM
jgi:hypothetical protein